ncbi:hypothetical protein AUR64_06985 [Haloprofundus marisrubri]|uniref:Uncharacterized protein n=1 Tax=Haloprofundus marisrubri TaxID=1514971 RepID=A0A0W1RCF1_9EURY|nr:hypothetical protein [Haloprofundus marisrubri]KTG10916.1 hypothetical protein AUR64_06985 [Haloprofundus marisrubri]
MSLSESPLPYVVSLAGVVIGLAVLLVGEALGAIDALVVGGGVVVLVGVGVLTAAVAMHPTPEEMTEETHSP